MDEEATPPPLRNQLLRNTAFVTLATVLAMTVDAYVFGRYVPSEVYAFATAIVGAWMGFSKWGEVRYRG